MYCYLYTNFKYFVYFIAGLGEFKLRDLNDEINKLLREKGHWEDRIKELNGPDYRVNANIYLIHPFNPTDHLS